VDARNDVLRVVFVDDPDCLPPQAGDEPGSLLIPHVPTAIRSVEIAVVLGRDFEVFPAHVEHRDQSPGVLDGNLSGRDGKARVDEQQAQPGLLR
jgi:hypothetical protein